MADKRISDLDATTTLNDDDLFIVRKTSANEDLKMTKLSLVNNLSNPGIVGFSVVMVDRDFTLTPLNGAIISQYLDGMKISFVAPSTITSLQLVRVRIGDNAFKSFLSPLRLRTYPEIVQNEYYEGVYRNGAFYHTNPKEVNYTNETTGLGVVSNNTTTYTLTSASGFFRHSYYVGMSVLFTSKINSIGPIYINLDSLGTKLLSDPDGDGVPFSLVENQTIMAIYDGTKFIKNLFAMTEPEVPFTQITINVGPTQFFSSNRTLQKAYNQIISDYGHDGGGRQVTIQFDDDYNGEGMYFEQYSYNTGYITIVGNPNIQMIAPSSNSSIFSVYSSNEREISHYVKLTGSWKIRLSADGSFVNLLRMGLAIRVVLDFQNLIVENQPSVQQFCHFIGNWVDAQARTPVKLTFYNVNIINFGYFIRDSLIKLIDSFITNLTFTNNFGVVSQKGQNLFVITGACQIDGLNINVTTPSNYLGSIIFFRDIGYQNVRSAPTESQIYLKNCNFILNQVATDYLFSAIQLYRMSIVLENCVIRHSDTVNNAKASLYFEKGLESAQQPFFKILGSDFRNKNSSTIPDIIADKTELFVKTSTTLGSTVALNGGKITVITE